MAKLYYERHSLALALKADLPSGWGITEIREGFQSEETITPPLVSVHFLPSKYIELQLGRSITTEKSYERRVQVDCYMETEPRAMSIADDVADFLDEMFINIVNPAGSIIGSLHCPDSETILIETISPRASDVRVNRWRSTIQATLQADYIV